MQVTQAIAANTYRPQAASGNAAPNPQNEPREKFVMDSSGGIAAGVLGLVMSGGAGSLERVGFSPSMAFGFDAFIGGSVGMQMADAIGKNKLAGAAIGAGLGLGAAYMGTQLGWPGAFITAGAFAVLRGVVLPSLLNR